jgi:prophage regulatory protein
MATRLLTYPELRAHGIVLSAKQLKRLEAKGTFPKRVKAGDQRVAWVESEIDAWVQERIDARE